MECRGGVRGARGVGWEGGEGRMCRREGDGNKRACAWLGAGGREGESTCSSSSPDAEEVVGELRL